MATHFDANGIPNGYSSRAFAVFGPYLICLLHICSVHLNTGRSEKQAIGQKMYALILWISSGSFPCSVQLQSMVIPLSEIYEIFQICDHTSGTSVLLVGNYLPKCRQNYTVGIKVPWTLASEANWDATHRMAGKLWVAWRLILLLAIQPWIPAFPISMVLILAVTFIPMIYSFVYYLRNEK